MFTHPDIRPATPADAAAIAAIYVESARHHVALSPERYSVPDADAVAARYRAGEQHPGGIAAAVTLVAEVEGSVGGFVDARLDAPVDPMHRPLTYLYVSEIAVAEHLRGQGLGTALLAAVEHWGRARGASLAVLEYNAANVCAARFYQRRMGYRDGSVVAFKEL